MMYVGGPSFCSLHFKLHFDGPFYGNSASGWESGRSACAPARLPPLLAFHAAPRLAAPACGDSQFRCSMLPAHPAKCAHTRV